MGYQESHFFRSRFLNVDALDGQGPLPLTIAAVTAEELGENGQEKPVLCFKEDDRGLVLNKTNWRALSDAFGPDTDGWTDQKVQLVVQRVDFRGKRVPAIRLQIPEPDVPF